MKQIYLLKHKYNPHWQYVGATTHKRINDSLAKKWCHRYKQNTLLFKAMRCSERSDWTITQLHDFSEDWTALEAKYIHEYDTFHNGLNSTASGAFESTVAHRASASRNGKRNGTANGKTRSKPVICCDTIFFDSAMEASRQTGINKGNISSCLSGKLKTAGGFTWRFA
jgi:hypothetical protein